MPNRHLPVMLTEVTISKQVVLIEAHIHYIMSQLLTECADCMAGVMHHLEGGLQSGGENIHLTEVPVIILENQDMYCTTQSIALQSDKNVWTCVNYVITITQY